MTDALTKTSAPDLASLLCSRLCHDLMNPVGALANGLELLADETDPQMRARCLSLLEQSVRTAGDKLRFFRIAFGASGNSGAADPVAVAEIKPLIEALARGAHPISVRWLLADEKLPMAAIKVLLNLAQIGLQGLVRGGTLDVGAEQTAHGCEIVVRAGAPRVVFDPDVGRALEGSLPLADLSARTAPAAMVHALARDHGGTVQVHKDVDTLLLGAELRISTGTAR